MNDVKICAICAFYFQNLGTLLSQEVGISVLEGKGLERSYNIVTTAQRTEIRTFFTLS